MLHVKICGIRHREDAEASVEAGASALGFNFWTGTPRYIVPSEAARIIASVPKQVCTVGVFVDEEPGRVLEIAAETGISVLQLHGHETPEYLDRLAAFPRVKAVKVSPNFAPEQLGRYRSVFAFLLDGFVAGLPGGTGQTFDWLVAEKAKMYGKIILAGGLKPSNVEEAVRQVRPWAVDVCSGVETKPGKKDRRLIREFIKAVRAAEGSAETRVPPNDSFCSPLL